jgi:hypothetical protein
MGGDREACGRCAMTSVTDATTDGKNDDERERSDPFAGSRIELTERELRRVSPSAWLSGAKRRLDELATRITYGR